MNMHGHSACMALGCHTPHSMAVPQQQLLGTWYTSRNEGGTPEQPLARLYYPAVLFLPRQGITVASISAAMHLRSLTMHPCA